MDVVTEVARRAREVAAHPLARNNVDIRMRDLLATVTLTVTMPAAYGFRVSLAGALIRAAAFVLGMKVSIIKIKRGDA